MLMGRGRERVRDKTGGILKDIRRDSSWIGMGTSFTEMEERQCGWVSKQINPNIGDLT